MSRIRCVLSPSGFMTRMPCCRPNKKSWQPMKVIPPKTGHARHLDRWLCSILEKAGSCHGGNADTLLRCCAGQGVADQGAEWRKAGAWVEVMEEKRGVVGAQLQLLTACQSLLQQADFPINGIVAVVMDLIR